MSLWTKFILSLMIVGVSFGQTVSNADFPYIQKRSIYPGGKDQPLLKNILESHPEYDVLLYDINITIVPESNNLQAQTSIHFNITKDIPEYLFFDFCGLQLDSVFLDSEKVSALIDNNLLVIDLTYPLMAGDTYVVKVYYQGIPEKGLYFRNNWYGDLVVYSHNEPYDARFWFPCKDDPSDKAQLKMAITVPDQFIVLSNGRLIAEEKAGLKLRRYFWQEDYPIATYLISIAAAPYLVTDDYFDWQGRELLLEYYVYPNDLTRGENALQIVKEMLGFYSLYIGDYPFFSDKYSMSEVPFREASAMENQTATTMGDFVMDNEEILAHELAHQWWGDALTPNSFADIWLNEGFATYFDALFTEYRFGREAFLERMDDFFNLIVSDGSLEYPIYNPPQQYLFGRAVYMKGAWVLHMIRLEVGDQVFNEIIQHYYQQYSYLNVVTADFIEIVEMTSGKSFAQFFDQWLNYGGMPLLLGSWTQTQNHVNLIINQEQAEPLYQFDLEVLIEGVSLDTVVTIPVRDRKSQKVTTFAEPVSKMIIDPQRKILNTNNSPIYRIPTQSVITRLSPNPFSGIITITYQVEKAEKVEIVIYDILGQIVEKLIDERKTTGIHQVEWNGAGYASGLYFCMMATSESSDVRKMTLIK